VTTLVIGIDPGLTTGLLALVVGTGGLPAREAIAVQIHGHGGVEPFVQSLIERDAGEGSSLLAVEAFVVGPRASKSASPFAGRITRNLVGELTALAGPRVRVFSRPAAVVKPWATDERLAAADLIVCTKAMPHARDAARHALYGAVHEGLMRDPLSRAAAR
jgi:hypothetical protein